MHFSICSEVWVRSFYDWESCSICNYSCSTSYYFVFTVISGNDNCLSLLNNFGEIFLQVRFFWTIESIKNLHLGRVAIYCCNVLGFAEMLLVTLTLLKFLIEFVLSGEIGLASSLICAVVSPKSKLHWRWGSFLSSAR